MRALRLSAPQPAAEPTQARAKSTFPHHDDAEKKVFRAEIYYNRNEILIYNVQSNASSLFAWKFRGAT
jgi:hypothetical protein